MVGCDHQHRCLSNSAIASTQTLRTVGGGRATLSDRRQTLQFHPRLRGRSRFCAGITRCSPNFRVTRPRRPPTKATSVLLPADSAGSSGFWGHYDCQLDANGVPSETEYVVGLEGVSFQKRQLALTFTTSILGKWTVSKNKGLVR